MSIRKSAAVAALSLVVSLLSATAFAQQGLNLEAKIPLGDVKGRIDHMTVDLARQRLYVAELGNNSMGVIDLKEGKVINRIPGINEAQGIAYLPSTDSVYVASGADGALHRFLGGDLKPGGMFPLGQDADNVHVDAASQRVYVGYAKGALAVIDAAAGKKLADIELAGHPEGFQIHGGMKRIFVNVPGAGQIAVIDMAEGKQVATWKLPRAGGNFPMAVDEAAGNVIVVTRGPAKLYVLDVNSGGVVEELDTCADSDDVFVDAKRQRYYVSCGAGSVDVFEYEEGNYRRNSVKTVAGARTSLYVPEIDRLFVAVRAAGEEPAAIWVFKPIR